jgi:hypothetical protein
MRRRGEPPPHDVPSAHLPPRAGEKILPERRISVAGSSHGRSQIAAAWRVRELPAGCNALAFQSGSVSERRPLLEAGTAIVEASPVDETADRTRLDCRRGCPIGRRLAHAGRSEKRVPGALGTIGLTDDEKGGQRTDDGRRQGEPNWSYRSRDHHGSHRAPEPTGDLALIGGLGVPRISDPAPRHGSLADSTASPGWCVRQVAAASNPTASVGRTVSAR